MIPLFLLMVCLLNPAQSHAAGVFNVRDFGAKGDGIADDSMAINQAVAAAVKAGPGATVIIPKGLYLLRDKSAFHIDNASGLTVTGASGTHIIEDDPNTSVVQINHCTDTTLKNFVIEQSHYHFTQGKVVAQDAADHTVDIHLDPGMPDVDDPLVLWKAHWTVDIVASPTSGRYEGPPYFGIAPTAVAKVGDRLWRLTFSDFRGWPAVDHDIDVRGKCLLLWNDRYGGHGIDAGNNANLSIQNVTYYGKGANAMFILWNDSGKTLIRGCICSVVPRSNAVLSCSGGGMYPNDRGTFVFENCDFEHFDDDGADFNTNYRRVLEQRDARTVVVQDGQDYRPGDQMTILDAFTFDETANAKVVTSERLFNGNSVVTLDRNLPTLHTGPGDDNNRAADGVDRIADCDNVPDVVYRHCTFQCNRARALNLKARSAMIVDCTFKNGDMPAIAAGPEMGWGEAPIIHNYTISGCTFTGIRDPSIEIGIFDVDKTKVMGYPISDITISDNHFDAYGPRGAIEIRNARHVMISGNTFGKPGWTLGAGIKPVNLYKCETVTLAANVGND